MMQQRHRPAGQQASQNVGRTVARTEDADGLLLLPTTTTCTSNQDTSDGNLQRLSLMSCCQSQKGRIRSSRQKERRRKRQWMFLQILLGLWMFQWWRHHRPHQCPSTTQTSAFKPQDVCFVTCIFGNSVEEVDQPANVEWFAQHWCRTQFLLVTNLPTLPSKGWTKIVQRRQQQQATAETFIVQSREAKFLAWRALATVQKECAAVIYMDGYLQPKHSWWWWFQQPTTYDKFQTIVEQVQQHPWGLSQVKQAYFNGLTMETILNNLVRDRKDTAEHVNATLSWLQQQEDYQPILTYYLNKYFAYDPNNIKYQELSSWFWQHYTTYGGLWRDQPLWAYTLHHFNCTPAIMTSKGTITKGGDLFETGGSLGWDKHVYV